MGLIAHFPLNNNTRDYAGNYTLTSTSISYENRAKVSDYCLLSNQQEHWMINPFIGKKEWSLSLWFKNNGSNDWSDIFTFSGSKFRLEVYESNASYNFYVDNGDYGRPLLNAQGTYGKTTDVWINVIVTYNNGAGAAYFDGSCVQRSSNGAVNFTAESDKLYFGTRIGGNKSNISINDIRCYDHCLTTKEINDINKALALQYDFGSTTKNLLLSTNSIQKATSDVYGFAGVSLPAGFLKNNRQYTLSVCGRSNYEKSTDYYLRTYLYDTGWSYQSLSFPNYNTTNSVETYTFTAGSAAESYNYAISSYNFPSGGAGTGNTSHVEWYKLEEGPKATPFTADSDQNKIESSTNGYNATGTNCVTTSDAKVGLSALHLGSTGYVTIPAIYLDKSFTICGWFKHIGSLAAWARIFDFGTSTQGSGYAIGLATSSATGDLTLFGRSGSGNALPDTYVGQVALNTWYHFAISYDDYWDDHTLKFYLNGELVKTFKTNAAIGKNRYVYNYIGKSNWSADPYSDKIVDDFRIYNTALYDTDIARIYNENAYFDSNKNVGTGEVLENKNAFKITKNKTIECDQIIEGHEKIRYIKLYENGSNQNTGNHIDRLAYVDVYGNESALCVAEGNRLFPAIVEGSYVSANTSASNPWADISNPVVFDIGRSVDASSIHLTRYWSDARHYYQTKLLVSNDMVNWKTVFDSGNNGAYGTDDLVGTYTETAGGKYFDIKSDDINLPRNPLNPRKLNGYTQLEYIGLTGTQYIDTGFYANQNTGVEMVASSTSTVNQAFYCSRSGMNSNTYSCFIVDTYIRHDYNTTQQSMTTKAYAGQLYQISSRNNVLKVNNTSDTIASGTFTAGTSLYLGASNANGIGNYLYGNIYSCKVFNGNTLVRDFIPVKRDSDSVVGLLDVVNNVFYVNKGSGSFTAGPIYGFQEVDYISASGSQYINTLYYHTTGSTSYKFKMSVDKTPNTYHTMFGARTEHDSADAFYLGVHNDKHTYGCIGAHKKDPIGYNIKYNNVMSIDAKFNKGWDIDGVLYSQPYTTSAGCIYPDYIFALNSKGTAGELMVGKVFEFKIFDRDALVRDFVPCYRKSGGAIGLFDRVHNVFFTNAGAGVFSKGTDVKRDYILAEEFMER